MSNSTQAPPPLLAKHSASNSSSSPPSASSSNPSASNSTSSIPSASNSSSSIPSAASHPSSFSGSSALIAGLVVAVAIIFFALNAFYFIRRRRRRRRKRQKTLAGDTQATSYPDASAQSVNIFPSSLNSVGPRSFSLQELHAATEKFNVAQLLGRGGFGDVYRGILADGTIVAVKRIANHSSQGIKEFLSELTSIGNLRHRHLVKLKGWCYAEGICMLVYEYMANGSLDHLLFHDVLCAKLTWTRRWSIALCLGSALQYLHEECDHVIIHRDVKSSNVLLDDGFNAKLGDFGLSRKMEQGITSHTTVLAGTRGYMGPELFMGLGKATCESDVFAFGAVLLEIATGKYIIDRSLLTSHDGLLLHWVWDMFRQGQLLKVVDKRLDESNVILEEAQKLLIVALACSHPEPKARPSIRHAMEALNGRAALPSVPSSRPVASFCALPSMSRMSRLLEDYSTDSQVTILTMSSSDSNTCTNLTMSSSHGDNLTMVSSGGNTCTNLTTSSSGGDPSSGSSSDPLTS
ncbi:hypothetical protein L7F22_046625 [Adiantum nelumboides]|nr:hypothetical protein [Adiantum nelumboides]